MHKPQIIGLTPHNGLLLYHWVPSPDAEHGLRCLTVTQSQGPPCLPVGILGAEIGMHPHSLEQQVRSPFPWWNSGKSQNAFLFHECRKLISKPALKTVYYATNASSSIHCIWSSLYTQSSFFLARTLWSSSYDPYLFFKPLGTVEEMCYWQACRPHGEIESKRAGEPAGWDWITGLVTPLLGTSASSSEVNQGPLWLLRLSRGFWWTGCLFTAASSGLSGNPISILWGTFDHLLESAVQVSVTSVRLGDSSGKGPHLSQSQKIWPGGSVSPWVGKREQTDFFPT